MAEFVNENFEKAKVVRRGEMPIPVAPRPVDAEARFLWCCPVCGWFRCQMVWERLNRRIKRALKRVQSKLSSKSEPFFKRLKLKQGVQLLGAASPLRKPFWEYVVPLPAKIGKRVK